MRNTKSAICQLKIVMLVEANTHYQLFWLLVTSHWLIVQLKWCLCVLEFNCVVSLNYPLQLHTVLPVITCKDDTFAGVVAYFRDALSLFIMLIILLVEVITND